MINYIKNIKFRLSDLFLIMWIGFGLAIYFERKRFVSYTPGNLLTFSQPFLLIILYFIIMVISLCAYLYLEYKRGSFKWNKWIFIVILFILFSQLITLSVTPNEITMDVYDINNNPYPIIALFNSQVKCIHFLTFFFVIVTISIGLFIFPKRFNNINIVSLMFYGFFIYAFVALIASFFIDDYVSFFKAIFGNNPTDKPLKDLCPKSIFGNSNTYGTYLESCVFFSLVNYNINKKKHNLYLGIFFFINMLLTFCKTGIIATVISLLVFLVIRLIAFTREKNKKGILTYLIPFLSAVIVITLFITIYTAINGYSFLEDFWSFTERGLIWDFAIQITRKTSFIHGAGYGVFGTLLANACGRYQMFSSSYSHNAFIAILGNGGIILLVPYICILLFGVYLVTKGVFKDKKIAPLGCCALSYTIHSCFEDIHFIVIEVIIMLLIVYHIEAEQAKANK